MFHRIPAHVVNGFTVALGIALIQALLQLAHGPRAAALALTGAICASLPDLPLRPERSWRRVLAGGLLGLAAAALMLALRGDARATAAGIAAIAFVAMMLLGFGPRAGPASFSAVLALVFTMGLPDGEPAAGVLGWQAVGVAAYLVWAWAASGLLQPLWRRLALGAALDAGAGLLRSRSALVLPDATGRAGEDADDKALRAWIRAEARLAERVQSARDLLFAARSSPAQQRQVAVLLRLIDLRDLLLASALEADRQRRDPAAQTLRGRWAARLLLLAGGLQDSRASLLGRDTPQRPLQGDALAADGAAATGAEAGAPPAALVQAIEQRLTYMADELRRIDALVRGVAAPAVPAVLDAKRLLAFVAPEGWPLKALRPHLRLASPVLRHALRAAAAFAAAYGIALALPWAAHPQWLVLSVAVVLRLTYDQTVARRNLRIAGTMIGCLVVLALSYVESAPLLALAFSVAIGLAHGFVVERYLLTAIAGTVMALLQAHLLEPTAGFPIAERLADTLIGAALAWAFSYVLPAWERSTLPAAIARMLDALRAYAALVLVCPPPATAQPAAAAESAAAQAMAMAATTGADPLADPLAASQSAAVSMVQRMARRQAYDMLGALSASLQRSAAEPARVRPDLRPLAALLDQAQRLMAHLSMLRLLLPHADPQQLRAAIEGAAADVDAALAPLAHSATLPQDVAAPDALPVSAWPEPPPQPPGPATLQPWLDWRLGVARTNAAELRRTAHRALALLRR